MYKKSYLLFLSMIICLFLFNVSVSAQTFLLTGNYMNTDNPLFSQYNYHGANQYSPYPFSFGPFPGSSSVYSGTYNFGASYGIPSNTLGYSLNPAVNQSIYIPSGTSMMESGFWTQHTTTGNYLFGATQQMQEMQMSFNLQYLLLQNKISHENRQFTLISNIMKNRHDTAKNAINNIR